MRYKTTQELFNTLEGRLNETIMSETNRRNILLDVEYVVYNEVSEVLNTLWEKSDDLTKRKIRAILDKYSV